MLSALGFGVRVPDSIGVKGLEKVIGDIAFGQAMPMPIWAMGCLSHERMYRSSGDGSGVTGSRGLVVSRIGEGDMIAISDVCGDGSMISLAGVLFGTLE